jgi:hypothetical protein
MGKRYHYRTGYCPSGPTMAKPSVDHIPLRGFVFIGQKSMSTLHGMVLQSPTDERRAVGRTMINRDVRMHYAGCDGIHACCVHDVTNLGAGIRLNDLKIVPFEFGISFDNFRTMRQCRLIWRNGDFVGVTFAT